jgi:hypothetical protein
MLRDLLNNLHLIKAIAPVAAVTNDTAAVSSIIDMRGYDSMIFAILTGTDADADATFAVTMEHGDDSGLSDTAAVTSADLVGTLALAGYTFADDAEPRKIGYCGIKRYVRLTITPTNNTGNFFVSVLAIMGRPHLAPTANPPI